MIFDCLDETCITVEQSHGSLGACSFVCDENVCVVAALLISKVLKYFVLRLAVECEAYFLLKYYNHQNS